MSVFSFRASRLCRYGLLASAVGGVASSITFSAAYSAESHEEWGGDSKGMDPSIFPGDNFFAYANGNYIRSLEIPPDMSAYGPFNILQELSLSRQKNILDNLTHHSSQQDTSKK